MKKEYVVYNISGHFDVKNWRKMSKTDLRKKIKIAPSTFIKMNAPMQE